LLTFYTVNRIQLTMPAVWHQDEAIKARAVPRGLARWKAFVSPYYRVWWEQFRSVHHLCQ